MAAALVACVLAAFAPAAADAAQDQPLSSEERRLVLQTLQAAPDPTDAPLASLPDPTLQAMILRHAEVETGQRVRPSQINPLWGLQPAPRDVAREFEAARQAGRLGAWLQTLSPADPSYRDLIAARRRYAALVAQGGWRPLPPGPILKPDEEHPLAGALRQRLLAEGYQVTALGDRFDAPLMDVLKVFQTRHGLEADGVLGPRTRAALDVSAEARLAQIDANLERARWAPRPLPADRLEVDVATAQATLFEAGAPVLSMRVVVGDLKHKTPIFASRLEAVVINPPWNVPASIANGEILPRAARDPGYLARNGFRYVDGRLQQRPGAGNALGRLKFDLPSPYGVYLHDTPSKSAFARTTRTLSHGCMRLEQPQALAAWLLVRQGWTPSRLEAAIGRGATQRVALETPLPLFVVYRTAFADRNGLGLWPDPYGWDAALGAALPHSQVADGPRGATECAEAAAG